MKAALMLTYSLALCYLFSYACHFLFFFSFFVSVLEQGKGGW